VASSGIDFLSIVRSTSVIRYAYMMHGLNNQLELERTVQSTVNLQRRREQDNVEVKDRLQMTRIKVSSISF
jgi:hypothetical protein